MFVKYNYLAPATSSETAILQDVIGILCGQTDNTKLYGKLLMSTAAVGLTINSATVTWAGADAGDVVAARKNIEVGQPVYVDNVQYGTVATVTTGTGFTLSTNYTLATDAAAIVTLGQHATTPTIPGSTIGNTSPTVNWNSGTSTTIINCTGIGTATILTNGMSVEGAGISTGATIASYTANAITITGGTVSGTVTNGTLVIKPASVVCDTANTSILTTYSVAGWKLYDGFANAGLPNIVVLSAPLSDDSTQFKYMGINVSTTGFMQLSLYESWNHATHNGTNAANAIASTSQQRTTATVAATMLISASARYCLLQSTIAAGIGASNLNEWTGVFERSRAAPWDTVAAGYPPTVLASGIAFLGTTGLTNQKMYAPRFKNPAGGDIITTSAYVYATVLGWSGATALTVGPGSSSSNVNIYVKEPDGAGGFFTPLADIHWRQGGTVGFPGGSISTVSDVWLGPAYPLNLDEVNYAGKIYVLLQNTNTSTTATANIAVPKG